MCKMCNNFLIIGRSNFYKPLNTENETTYFEFFAEKMSSMSEKTLNCFKKKNYR